MNKVAIVSCETSKFRKDSRGSVFDDAVQTCSALLKKCVLPKSQIGAVLFSSCAGEQYSSSIISEMLGMTPTISHRIDNLCNSGTDAIVSAFSYIASGICDSALVVGAEQANSPGNQLLWDISRGSFNFPVHWAAMYAKNHMRKFGTTEEQMAKVAVKNRLNATRNPKAIFKDSVTIDDVLYSRRIVDPIKMLDCSMLCSGSAAVLLLSEEKTKQVTDNPVWIKGIGRQTASASFSSVLGDLSSILPAKKAANDAYKMAKISPASIDVVELHDAFSILEIIAYEDLGFTEKGKGGIFVNERRMDINPRGGIIGCGHPVGATGVAQTAEIVAQLSNEAGGRQVKECKNGLILNMAAAGTSATVIILGTDR
jgi:acetyl-CoA C-acetyltransferase